MNLEEMRRAYGLGRLEREALGTDPVGLLGRWLEEARGAGQIEPNAMALATADERGRPSLRMVLLKGIGPEGLVFYTNYESRKGRELARNPWAAATLWWDRIQRQVRVEGRVERLPEAASRAYFARRPYGSRIGAWASRQGEPVEDREALEAAAEEARRRWPEGSEVPKPPYWGGYRIVPERLEFWQGREDRLHDRFVCDRDGDDWRVHRLAP